jgi:membrane protein implicated in regulation of membrane protease activity
VSNILDLQMIWWFWILLGLLLAAIELATPGGFFFIFFAVSALLVGMLELLHILESDALQWGLFSILSLVCLAFFRKPLLERMNREARGEAAVDSLVGELATATAPIAAGDHGRAEVRGATWTVRNVDTVPLAVGDRGRVVAVNGLELDIRSERSR